MRLKERPELPNPNRPVDLLRVDAANAMAEVAYRNALELVQLGRGVVIDPTNSHMWDLVAAGEFLGRPDVYRVVITYSLLFRRKANRICA